MSTRTHKTISAKARFAYLFAAASIALTPVKALAQVSVTVDPGHGGKDPGAMGPGIMEKRTNLEISKAVVREARRQGWRVSMTRSTDRFVDLVKRPAVANRNRSDVFVSIHSNSTGRKALGNMTIYRTTAGARLGAQIMRQIAPLSGSGDGGNRRDVRGLAVLRAAKRPAVLVEIMSVTAPAERWQLKNPARQHAYAVAIVRGIAAYKHVAFKPEKRAVRRPAPKPKARVISTVKPAKVVAKPANRPVAKPVAKPAVVQANRPNLNKRVDDSPAKGWLLFEAAKAFRKAHLPAIIETGITNGFTAN